MGVAEAQEGPAKRDDRGGVTVGVTLTTPPATKAAAKVVYNGKTYYFCSAGCKAKFEKAPAQYVKS